MNLQDLNAKDVCKHYEKPETMKTNFELKFTGKIIP